MSAACIGQHLVCSCDMFADSIYQIGHDRGRDQRYRIDVRLGLEHNVLIASAIEQRWL